MRSNTTYPRKAIDGFGCPGNARIPLEDRRRSRNSDGGSVRVLEEKGLLKWWRGVKRSRRVDENATTTTTTGGGGNGGGGGG